MTRGRISSFLKILPLTFLIAMGTWALVRPVYESAVAGLSQVLIRSFEYPKETRLEVKGHQVEVDRGDYQHGSGKPLIPLTEIHFNLIILLSLSFALHKPWSRPHLEKLFMGVALLYLSHAINLLLHVKCIYALNLGEFSTQHYSDFARDFYGFWRYFTDLPGRFSFPFIIWLSFNWEEIIGLISLPSSEKTKKERGNRRKKKA